MEAVVLQRASLFAGLRLIPAEPKRAAIAALGVIGAMSLAIAACDLLFRPALPAWYLTTFTSPDSVQRLQVFMPLAIREDLRFRLLFMSAFVVGGRLLFGSRFPTAVVAAAIGLAAFLNIAPNWFTMDGAAQTIWYGLRYFVPCVIWGWLYWRHGFLTVLLAHPACHLALDPLLFACLQAG